VTLAMRDSEPSAAVTAQLLRLQRRQAIPVIALPFAGLVVLLLFRREPTALRLALFASFYLVSMLGVTVGFHRLLSHASFACPRAVRGVLAAMGCLAAEGPPIFWVATHRLHHQHSDQEGDPHSPALLVPGAGRLRGFVHAHVGWMLTAVPANPLRYAPDLLRDPVIVRVNRRYRAILAAGLVAPALLGLALEGGAVGALDGLLWGGLARICAAQHATWAINSVCHLYGSRPWRTREASRNNWLVALFALGEGWHNNHHAAPTSAAHGLRWWQLDPSFAFVRLLRALGLAEKVTVADPARLEARAHSPR
jgi:stearoyl-CoA desaturase (delta-9 desaturase)